MNALRAAAFSEDQATVLVETLGEAQLRLATKDDLNQAFSTLRGDIETSETGIRHDMEKMETGIRHDMQKMEASIRHDMVEMKSDLRGEIQALYAKMEDRFQKVQWFILSSIGGATGILGMMIVFTST
ncbi:MAG: hypothetical protein OXJ38_05150 [Gammaproteobacteria bacterium]|nr:hypothetical protein [Gammaproteobacteria bacterium]